MYWFLTYIDIKIWNASRICVSSLRRGHANLLYIVPTLVYVLPKRARFLILNMSFMLEGSGLTLPLLFRWLGLTHGPRLLWIVVPIPISFSDIWSIIWACWFSSAKLLWLPVVSAGHFWGTGEGIETWIPSNEEAAGVCTTCLPWRLLLGEESLRSVQTKRLPWLKREDPANSDSQPPLCLWREGKSLPC